MDAPAPKRFARALEGKRFIITSAQNATPVHAGFLAALKTAAAALEAELVVIPFRYKNPTSVWSAKQASDEWWAPELVPFLHNVRKKLCDNLVLAGDVKIQPTASSPLTGFESLTGAESCILGHPKMQLRSVPVPTGRFPKILTTTGAVSKRNYTDSKAGKLGAFHHHLGAIVVETRGKQFRLWQVNSDRETGAFIHLDKHYDASGVTTAPPAIGLVLGDSHAKFACPDADRATFGPGGIVETLNPQTLVFHDVFDGYTVNPHHRGNPFIASAKRHMRVAEEVMHAIEFVADRSEGRNAVIVASNHDHFLSRWVAETDWRHAPHDATFYLETATAMLTSAKLGPGGTEYADPFAYWVNRSGADIRCLGPNENFELGGIECGMHGHHGPNGARGTLKNLSRLGARVISGHTHSPGIEEGHYQCGTSSPLRLEYTKGPSSWLNCHCIVYANGKRSLMFIIGKEWKL